MATSSAALIVYGVVFGEVKWRCLAVHRSVKKTLVMGLSPNSGDEDSSTHDWDAGSIVERVKGNYRS